MTLEYTNSECEIRAVRSTSVLWLQAVTVIWMLAECGVSLFAAARAHRPALLAFAADSLVERAGKIATILLFALAAVVTVIAALSLAFDVKPESSTLGIGVTVIALIIMPVLGWLKRQEARRLNNSAWQRTPLNRQPVPILQASHCSALD